MPRTWPAGRFRGSKDPRGAWGAMTYISGYSSARKGAPMYIICITLSLPLSPPPWRYRISGRGPVASGVYSWYRTPFSLWAEKFSYISVLTSSTWARSMVRPQPVMEKRPSQPKGSTSRRRVPSVRVTPVMPALSSLDRKPLKLSFTVKSSGRGAGPVKSAASKASTFQPSLVILVYAVIFPILSPS